MKLYGNEKEKKLFEKIKLFTLIALDIIFFSVSMSAESRAAQFFFFLLFIACIALTIGLKKIKECISSITSKSKTTNKAEASIKSATFLQEEVKKPDFSEYNDGQLMKYHYEDVEIGLLANLPFSLEEIKLYEYVDLIQKDGGICIFYNFKQIGYLRKGKIQEMVNDFKGRGEFVTAFISSIDIKSNSISVDMAFYKKAKPIYKGKVNGNKNEEMQGNLMGVYEGDRVDFDYNYEKETFEAFVDGSLSIGYLPKSCTKKLEEADSIKGYIADIDFDDNDEYIATVVIYD